MLQLSNDPTATFLGSSVGVLKSFRWRVSGNIMLCLTWHKTVKSNEKGIPNIKASTEEKVTLNSRSHFNTFQR